MNEKIHITNRPNHITEHWLQRMNNYGNHYQRYRASLRNAGSMRMDQTYIELLNILPPDEDYPIERKMYLEPCDYYNSYSKTLNTWKYFKVMYYPRAFNEEPFVVWARDGRIRIDPFCHSERAIASRLNLLITKGRQHRRDCAVEMQGILRVGRHGFTNFTSHRGRVHYRFRDGSMLPVTKGDVFDTNTLEVHSRLLAGKPPLTSLTADIDSCPISDNKLQLFKEAPLNPSIRSAIRSETNVVLPDTVTDERSLQRFFRQQRMIVSEEGVWAV